MEETDTVHMAAGTCSTEKLLHELQIHQIELEMQNESMRHAQILLETSHNRYVDLYDFAPVGYLTLSLENLIIEINLTAASMLGIERQKLLLHYFPQWIADGSRDDWHRAFLQIEQLRKKQSFELSMRRSDGSTFHARADCDILADHEPRQSVRMALTDISERKAMENALRNSETHLRLCQTAGGIGTWEADLVDNKQKWSENCTVLLGCPAISDPTWEDFLALVHPEDRQRMIAATQAHIERGVPYDVEYRVLTTAGDIHWLRSAGQVERDEHGKPVIMRGVVQDMTERRNNQLQIENSLSLLSATLESSNDALLVVDLDGIWILHNQQFVDLWRIPNRIIEARDDNQALAHVLDQLKNPQAFLHKVKELYANPEASSFDKVEFKDGKIIERYSIPQRIDGKVGGRVWSFRDITLRERAEQALNEADQRKDLFLAMLAHELRNPLAPIRNAVNILKRDSSDLNRLAWCIDILDRQSEHLQGLVDDLLDVSRISRGLIELNKELLEIRDFIFPAVESCQPLLDARRQKFCLELPTEPTWIEGDRIRLAQVVSNLLNNAAKYTQEGGEIHLSAECREDMIGIRVQDNGCGFTPDDVSNLFDLFYQVDRNLARSKGGLGIGLSLVRSLVAEHGGQVQAFSAGLDQGSEFVVRLPLRVPLAPTAAAMALNRPAPGKLRILVVDDNRDVAKSLAMLLEINEYPVWVAYDGPSSLEIAGIEQPDVIVVDIGLPGMDGYAVAQALRGNNDLKQPLLIAFSGYGQPQDREKSMAAGFDAHLVKPLDIKILHKLLDDYQINSA